MWEKQQNSTSSKQHVQSLSVQLNGENGLKKKSVGGVTCQGQMPCSSGNGRGDCQLPKTGVGDLNWQPPGPCSNCTAPAVILLLSSLTQPADNRAADKHAGEHLPRLSLSLHVDSCSVYIKHLFTTVL